jgi:signal transduction histidine kinase
LAIEDNGPGIAEDERQRVFERFYRIANSEQDGCGLGLSIAKEIAARHEADLELHSTASGVGTTAVISFKARHSLQVQSV